MLKIYGANLSSPANKVRFVANYLGLDYDYIIVKIAEGEHQTPEYRQLHPAGKVPAIDDDGFTLFESDAICKYLARKEKSELYPPDIKEQAKVDQWVNFLSIHVSGAMGRILFNRVFAPKIGVPVDENSMNDGVKFLNRFLPVLDKQLENNKFMIGDQITLADINFVASLDPLEVGGISLEKYTNIARLRNELQQQDFYTKCHVNYAAVLEKTFAERT